ncbi:polyketide synthase [Penicillium canariense]|uniref:Polyketide synthase n=1 Tax=Penicillium canariense TaxID=189055 RepID=A0A9W9LG24_9EURO|nr:polyketide synthase [Penicillium canariense]KAJ5153188.1 polyketide synthase [Penicillium canariense]
MATYQSPILSGPRPPPVEIFDVFRGAISTETGVKLGDADGNILFDDIGLDPITRFAILDIVADRTGVELPASLFRDCSTLSEVAGILGYSTDTNAVMSPLTPIRGVDSQVTAQDAFAGIGHLVKQFAAETGTATFWTEVLTKHNRVFDGAILPILEDGGFVNRQGNEFVRTSVAAGQLPSQIIFDNLVHDHPLYANMHRLLNLTGSQFAECLTGAVDPIKLLFGKNKDLLQDFYTNAPMSLAASKYLAAFLKRIFSDIVKRDGGCIEILEVGAGLGGTTKFVVDMLVDAKIPFKYTFTDISSSFFAAAKNRYNTLPAGCMEYVVLDIEKAPPEKLQRRFHSVISTNCIHATKSLQVSCTNIRKLLRPRGFCALIEFTTRLYWLDLVFGLLDGWWLFEDDRKHCTADEAFWRSCLEASGFSDVLWTEADKNEKLNPQLVVACTE